MPVQGKQIDLPSRDDAALAARAGRTLAANLPMGVLRLHLDNWQEAVLPKAASLPIVRAMKLAARLLAELLVELGAGDAVTLAPSQPNLTVREAARLLNVAATWLGERLAQGDLPFNHDGTRRRIRLENLQIYRDTLAAECRAVIAAQARASPQPA